MGTDLPVTQVLFCVVFQIDISRAYMQEFRMKEKADGAICDLIFG